MSNTKTKGVELASSATVSTSSSLLEVPITPNVKKGGTGEYISVWPKKDLMGKAAQMERKADDRIVNKNEIVKDPETGLDIFLIRVHRGKRVWYAKGVVNERTQKMAELAEEAGA